MDDMQRIRSSSDHSRRGHQLPQGKTSRRNKNGEGRHSPYNSPVGSPGLLRVGMRRLSVSSPEVKQIEEQQRAGHAFCWRTNGGRLKTIEVSPIGSKIYVGDSIIPNANRGLFSKIKISKGKLITYFDGGVRHTTFELKDQASRGAIDSTYLVAANFSHHIDCIRDPIDGAGGGSFANDSLGCAVLTNAEIVQQDEPGYTGVFLKATRDISPDEEILCPYSESHWNWTKARLRRQGESFGITEKRLTLGALKRLFEKYQGKIEWMTAELIREGCSFPHWPDLKTLPPSPSSLTGEDKEMNEKYLAVELLCFKFELLDCLSLSQKLIQRMKKPPVHLTRSSELVLQCSS